MSYPFRSFRPRPRLHRFAIRKLGPRDREGYRLHLLGLTAADRRRRFHGALNDASIDAHVGGLDFARTELLGAFVRGRLRGVVEIAFGAEGAAEMGVSVETRWQRTGLGGELVRRGVRLARNRGARRVWMFCLPDNEPMQRIAKKLHGQLTLEEATVNAELPLAPATLRSRIEEQVANGVGAVRALSQMATRLTRRAA